MKKTAEKVNINSGRVLSDFVTVIENNKRYLQHHFESDLKLAIGDINRILDDALRRRIENESTVAEQVSVLGNACCGWLKSKPAWIGQLLNWDRFGGTSP